MHITKIGFFIILSAALAGLVCSGCARRKPADLTEAEKLRFLRDGMGFDASLAYADAFDAVVECLRDRNGDTVTINKDAGLITSITEKGGERQTSTCVMVSLIKQSEKATTVRVAVATQTLGRSWFSSWSKPKVTTGETNEMVKTLNARIFDHTISQQLNQLRVAPITW
ncbi:hypothetical protein OH491_28070 (plasmid) [Termitidicoccus mucosus]|uniref:Uncharacterized protein n=1 Tax=Termitidicoccus mucosus TaxID=1184151 RepID=A0A178IPZ8_9BACT|nr:hypothetical protein AW736_26190 [Opitutaceae bacterium TSB47]